ncbi:MAG: hypothetical protein PHU93_01855 [Candidatus Gracilibacteria bacterium]|nr:hypothetical protein [Candidatus Gracilibacteria bacterium]
MPAHSPRFTVAFNKIGTKPTQSKMKFTGKFKDELQKVSTMLETSFENATGHSFEIDAIVPGNNNIRLKISSEELAAEMQINCIFWYHHDDERYGRLNIDLATSGFSRKGKVKFVGTFDILDQETIREKVWKELLVCAKSL